MINTFTRGLAHSLLSVRTVAATLLIGAYALLQVAGMTGGRDNAWDAVIPTLTEALVVAVVGLTWWLSWVIPATLTCGTEQHLIRFGSLTRAVISNLVFLAGVMTGFALLVAAVTLGVTARLGFSTTWSTTASSFADGTPSAFSASGFAQHFTGPVPAVAMSLFFAATGFLIVAALTLAISARGHARLAVGCIVGAGMWIIICSFSPVPVPATIDASLLVSLGWALAVPKGLAIAIIWWAAASVAAITLTMAPIGSLRIRAAMKGRAASLAALLSVAIVAAINAANRASAQGNTVPGAFYAGPYGDIVSYLLVAAIPAGFATVFLARTADAAEGSLLYEALRRGSYRKWVGAALAREAVWAVALLAGVTAVILVAAALVGDQDAAPRATLMQTAIGSIGLLAAIALQCVTAAGLLWTEASLTIAWPVTVSVLLALGYWFPRNLAVLNVVAPYGTPQDTLWPAIPVVATAFAVVFTLVYAGIVIVRAVPKHADQIG